MRIQVEETFTEFYEKWIAQLEQLLHVDKAGDEDTINMLMTHHEEYYAAKWASARRDVLAFFSPIWLSPFEKAHLWITGWKPSIAYRLMAKSNERVNRLEDLREKIKADEERVEREHAAVLDWMTVKLTRLGLHRTHVPVDVSLNDVLGGLERVTKRADCVGLRAIRGVLDALTDKESVDFLVAMSMLEIQIRKWGKTREETKNLD